MSMIQFLTYRYSTDTHEAECPYCGHRTILGNTDDEREANLPEVDVCKHYSTAIFNPQGNRRFSSCYNDRSKADE